MCMVPETLASNGELKACRHDKGRVRLQHGELNGGGGEVGMSCYNNFSLCKSIATFPLPILTGIGHSTNMTVAEMVAFRNAITPTTTNDDHHIEVLLHTFDFFQLFLDRCHRQVTLQVGGEQHCEQTVSA